MCVGAFVGKLGEWFESYFCRIAKPATFLICLCEHAFACVCVCRLDGGCLDRCPLGMLVDHARSHPNCTQWQLNRRNNFQLCHRCCLCPKPIFLSSFFAILHALHFWFRVYSGFGFNVCFFLVWFVCFIFWKWIFFGFLISLFFIFSARLNKYITTHYWLINLHSYRLFIIVFKLQKFILATRTKRKCSTLI